jgi:hypothetical protein
MVMRRAPSFKVPEKPALLRSQSMSSLPSGKTLSSAPAKGKLGDGLPPRAPNDSPHAKRSAPDSGDADVGSDVRAANDGPGVKNADVKKTAATAGLAGLGAAAGLAAIFSAKGRRECVDEWRQQHTELWQGDEQSTLDWLLQKTKTSAGAEHQKAYDALYECKSRDFFGNTLSGLGKSVVSPVAGVFGDSVGQFFGPIAKALEPVKWVLVALLCALVAGAAYKMYTVLVARRAVPVLEEPTPRFGYV